MMEEGGIYIVVPAYNEEPAIHDVVRDLRALFPNVVVVDDGSADATAAEARRAGAVVVQHLLNRGQGAALQTGIDYSVGRGADIVVTFDADGQHRVEDIPRLIEALERHGSDVAIGSRFLGLESNMPAPRRLLLRTAARLMRVTSGVALTDAHNGLRAMRRGAAERIHLTIDGMAHASELVDQIDRLRLTVTEVPVVIHYSDYSLQKGQSGLAAFRIAFDYLMKRLFR
ncbi:MAG TPA: glycosyltransferase family 2 protein [Thermoanaerobaculia bacterium]|nr:glycosyltransferase family 2 protein [Thermoanaerobaculia bacterium]